MTSVQNPTYLLAPQWKYLPNGPIALGNIVADPFLPHRILSKPTKPLPETATAKELNWQLATEKVRNFNAKIWTQLAGVANVKLAANSNKSQGGMFTMKSLDTVYFVEEPSIEDITERVSEPENGRLRNTLKKDSAFSHPVYMISGIKIARGFQLTHKTSSSQGIVAEGSGTVTTGVSVGAGVGATITDSRSDGFKSANDIVFAYELLQIKPKGWGKGKALEITEFHNNAAFLSDEGDEEASDGNKASVEVEKSSTQVVDLIDGQDEGAVADLPGEQLAWLFQDL